MNTTKGLVVPADGGKHFDMAPPGRFAALKLLGHETNESVMLFEETIPAGTKSLFNQHRDSDEVAWILAGEITFRIGDEVTVGGPGTCAFFPRNVPHAWKNTGLRMAGHRVWKITKAIGARAGVPELHPHAFRHSRGVELLRRSGGNLRAVQEHLRHADIQTTTVYTRLTQSGLQKVIGAFDINNGDGNTDSRPPRHLNSGAKTPAVSEWWPERDSSPCFSLERAHGSVDPARS